jgi:Na+-translocating ferredoxin:NAD+ oxidoreductase subunit B
MSALKPEDIDALLPQTQCGLCGYGGCMPYAEALVYEQAAINLCLPGGVNVLKKIGALLQQNIDAFAAEMQQKTKAPTIVNIREAECIGCTKCIQVCPVDAIIGRNKHMHTVIAAECTGCELCIPACPVDCIDIIPLSTQNMLEQKSTHARQRFQARENRLREQKKEKTRRLQFQTLDDRKAYITAALARAKRK